MGRRLKNVGESFKTSGELLWFLTRRGQWWLLPVILVGLFAAAVLTAGQLGVFGWIYVIF